MKFTRAYIDLFRFNEEALKSRGVTEEEISKQAHNQAFAFSALLVILGVCVVAGNYLI